MGARTAISWTDSSWNPVTGCTKVSRGCDHCYAETIAQRFAGHPAFPRGFEITERPHRLDQPLRWREPRRIFVNSMSDLFHAEIGLAYIADVFAVMALAPHHIFQVLTKRHGRMRSLLNDEEFREQVNWHVTRRVLDGADGGHLAERRGVSCVSWPLPHVWLGVSVEDQHWADIRIPALLDTPAAVRFLSCEPLLGSIDLNPFTPQCRTAARDHNGLHPVCAHHSKGLPSLIDWVIVGGESGRGARPMHPDWARNLRDQCAAAGVPFHFKQWGEWAPLGTLYEQFDDDESADEARMAAVYAEVVDKHEVIQLERGGYIVDDYQPTDVRTWLMERVGKKTAGRILDGRTWDEFPAVRS